ncbi:MAG: hypothetical protein HY506_00475 [Candidatus Yanofskybacteria bacterium]|nr:hypothetical protein [Candidatus Yanofskybacteria bacterium]
MPTAKQLRHLPKVLPRKERVLILILSILALGSLIAIPVSAYYHFTKPAPDFGGSYTEGLVGAPKYINPLLSQGSDVDRDLSAIIYEGLMKYDNDGKLQPALAESYRISDDGLTYTFDLRPNLKWHDGLPITASDVVFTILAVQNSDYASSHRINWQGVEVNKLDESSVEFKLKNKYAQFLGNTTMGILPEHIWENVKATSFALSEFNIKPTVGSGPYKFSKIKRNTLGNVKSIGLESFGDYYIGKPYISEVNFKFYASDAEIIEAYNNNDIDGIGSIPAQKISSIRFAGRLKIQKINMPRYFAVFFNQSKSKPLSDKNIRLALNHATNKQEILSRVLSGNGTVVGSPLLPGIIDLSDTAQKYDFDAEKSKQILEEAGWKVNTEIENSPENDGSNTTIREKAAPPPAKNQQPDEPTRLTIRLSTSNWPELITVAEEIKRQWEAVGIGVELNVLPLPELQQIIRDREYEALLFGEVLGLDPDPFSFWHSSQKRDPGLNLALYDNKDADKILEEARQTLENSSRLSKYDDFQKIVSQDTPAIFLYSPSYIYGLPAKIKNVEIRTIPLPSDRFNGINRWYIKTERVKK